MAGKAREFWDEAARGAVLAAALLFATAATAQAQDQAPAVPGADAPALAAPAGDTTAAPPVAAPTDLSAPAEPGTGALVAPSETEGAAAPAAGAPGQAQAPAATPAPASPPASTMTGDTPTTAAEAPATGGAPATGLEPAAPAEESPLPADLSPWGMFLAADAVVRGVMIGLAVASLVTWTVLFAKGIEFLLATLRLRRGYAVVSRASDLANAGRALAGRRGPAAQMVRAAAQETHASTEAIPRGGAAGLLQRVGSHLGRIEHQAGRRLNAGTGVLATIGATAPFVGLFGTVWGIMNSFIGISESQTTNLAVVAPGIAEALLATALGLVAAIPAVVVYNVFARWSAAYRARLADAAAAVERLVSRDLDHDRLGAVSFARAAE